jgi:hypothetical protein
VVTQLAKDETHKIFTLPEGYRPSLTENFVCQGSVANRWLCSISNTGAVTISRYGTTAFIDIPQGNWLPMSVSFLVD